MRSSKNRSRSKSNRQRSIGNIINRVFDSSGPEGKVRGTPQQIIEKYLMLARDAQLGNDRVAEQNFLQHAEHYTRMLGEAQAELAREQAQRQPTGGNGDRQPFNGQRDRDDGQPIASGSYAEPAGLYDVEEAGLVETPEMRSRNDNDHRREPRREQGQGGGQQRYEGQRNEGQRNEGQRNEGQRNEGQRDRNRGDADRGDQGQGEAPQRAEGGRSDSPRQDGSRQENPRQDQRKYEPRQDQPRREPRAPRNRNDETADSSGADIPLPAFVAAPLQRPAEAPAGDAVTEKPKPRRRTAKPVAVNATTAPDRDEPSDE